MAKKLLTFIGNGNMAYAIANGLKHDYDIEVVGRNEENLALFEKKLGVSIGKSNLDKFDYSDRTVILCVKPYNVVEVSSRLRGMAKVVYSVLAGVPIETLQRHFDVESIVRIMPNLGATKGVSTTILTGDTGFVDEATEIFGAIGDTLWVENEKHLDIGTGLCSSGIAYLSVVAEALADGAVREGLPREYATTLTRGLFKSFSHIVQDEHPAILKDQTMSAGGTTAAGYAELENHKVRAAFIAALQAAYKRSQEL